MRQSMKSVMQKNNCCMKIESNWMKYMMNNRQVLKLMEQRRRYRGNCPCNRGTPHKVAQCLKTHYQRSLLIAQTSISRFAHQSQNSFMGNHLRKSFEYTPVMRALFSKKSLTMNFLLILECLHSHWVQSRSTWNCSIQSLFMCRRYPRTNLCRT